jgi:hypothetical protein
LWLRGGELHTLPPEQWQTREYRVLFSRLSTSRDTGVSFTHTLLYQTAASIDGIYPDLSYLPPPNDTALFDQESVPWLLGTTSKQCASAFDCIAVSNAVIQELVNLPVVLRKSNIPLAKTGRMADPHIPLIILGGANAAATPMMWGPDSPVDGVFVGSDLSAITNLLTTCRDAKRQGLPKAEILVRLEQIPGFFQSGNPDSRPVVVAVTNGAPIDLSAAPVPFTVEAPGTGHLAISDGCPCACSFCLESWMHKPYREIPLAELREQALVMKAALGLDTIELFSFNFNMHRDIIPILWELSAVFGAIGLKTQRFDLLARMPAMLDILAAVGKNSLTCGMEGISARIRRFLNKAMTDKDLHTGISLILDAPVRELKIFLIATGLETEADFTEFRELVQSMVEQRRRAGRSPRVIFSLTPLVCFPCTPLENRDAATQERMEAVIDRIAGIARACGFEFRQACSLAEYWFSQVAARAGDPRVAAALTAAADKTGLLYYRDIPGALVERFREELRQAGIEPDSQLAGSESTTQTPWAFVKPGAGFDRIREQCLHFGEAGAAPVAAIDREPAATVHVSSAEINGRPAARALRERIKTNAATEATVRIPITIAAQRRGIPRRYLAMVLSRAIMLADTALVQDYRGYRSTFWSATPCADWICGDDVMELVWANNAAAQLQQRLTDPDFLARINGRCMGWLQAAGAVWPEPLNPRLTCTSPFTPVVDTYLTRRSLRHTRHKRGDGGYTFEFTRDALKKKILTALTTIPHDNGWRVTLVPGPHFGLEEFLTEAFAAPDKQDWPLIQVWSELNPAPLSL